MPSIIRSGEDKIKKLLVSVCFTFHLSDPAGIIPWNASPGKACGATLGEICNTSEVRGHSPSSSSRPLSHLSVPSLTRFSLLTVLPVLPPLHRRSSRRRSHRHRAGKPPPRSPPIKRCTEICKLPWRVHLLP